MFDKILVCKFEHLCIFRGSIVCDFTPKVIYYTSNIYQFSSFQPLSHVQLFETPWTVACQASLSITNTWSLPKLMSIKSVMPSNHPILRCPLLVLPSILPKFRVFSNESVLHFRWPKYWSFSLNHQSFQWISRTDFL